ncbi:ANTAR domain-containing protein [Blastococcus sp. SYSU D01042]
MSTPTPVLPRHRARPPRPPVSTAVPPGGPDPGSTADADRAAALEVEVAQLRAAMASRACIEQAKGILMLLTGCTDPVAFALLTHISGHTHRKVRDVALAITASASGATPLPPDIRAIVRDACPPPAPHG